MTSSIPAFSSIRRGVPTVLALALLWVACGGNVVVDSGHGNGGAAAASSSSGSFTCCPGPGPCLAGCASDADCPTGFICDTCGACWKALACANDADCPSGAWCHGSCTTGASCTGNADCPSGAVCDVAHDGCYLTQG